MREVGKKRLEKTEGDDESKSGSNCHGQGSWTVVESEHNKITRKELEENKKTRNYITWKLEVQECRRLALNRNGSTIQDVFLI